MPHYRWEEFLRKWSGDLIASQTFADELSYNSAAYPPDALKSGWLGYPGATETQIVSLENRLNTKLPPSYREFLKVSNGWRFTGNFVSQIWSTEQVEWLKNSKRETPNTADGFALWEGQVTNEEIDNAYIQKCSAIPPAYYTYLKEGLEISDFEQGGSAQYFLIPQIKDKNGEWEAWIYAHWFPGVIRFASFWDLMQKEYLNFLANEEGRIWRRNKGRELIEQKRIKRTKFGFLDKIFR